jgi:hypothetical protein
MIERYGFPAYPETLAGYIDRGESKFVMSALGGKEIHAVNLGGNKVICVYAPPLPRRPYGIVVTVLPPDMPREAKILEARRIDDLERRRRETAKRFFRDLKNQEPEDDFND